VWWGWTGLCQYLGWLEDPPPLPPQISSPLTTGKITRFRSWCMLESWNDDLAWTSWPGIRVDISWGWNARLTYYFISSGINMSCHEGLVEFNIFAHLFGRKLSRCWKLFLWALLNLSIKFKIFHSRLRKAHCKVSKTVIHFFR
jgi:uncharacterized membrane protein YuzA (DUF378 family)